MRIPPAEDATTATVDQVQRLVGLLGDDSDVPMFVFDAGYDPIALGAGSPMPAPRSSCASAPNGSSTPTPLPHRPDDRAAPPPRHASLRRPRHLARPDRP